RRSMSLALSAVSAARAQRRTESAAPSGDAKSAALQALSLSSFTTFVNIARGAADPPCGGLGLHPAGTNDYLSASFRRRCLIQPSLTTRNSFEASACSIP